MAWTAPRTWTTSEVVSAAIMNTHVRDDFLETAPAKVTTAGDTVYATAANALARLPIGAAGAVYTVSGGLPAWVAPTNGVWQTADSSAVNNSTTKVSTQLTWAMGPNDVWTFDGLLYGTNVGAAVHQRYGWSLPSGFFLTWRAEVIGAAVDSAAFGGGATVVGVDRTGTTTDADSAAVASSLTHVAGIIWGDNVHSGSPVLQFAQGTADPSNSVFKKGSHLMLQKIA